MEHEKQITPPGTEPLEPQNIEVIEDIDLVEISDILREEEEKFGKKIDDFLEGKK
jgi:hypothetical protein